MTAFTAKDKLREVIARRDAIIVTGIGTSLATLGGKPDPNSFVTWKGLLRSGLERILELKGAGFQSKYERKIQDLETGDIQDWMDIGDLIAGELKDGVYARWLKDTLGSLPTKGLVPDLVQLLASTGLPIITTNYDDYFRHVAGLEPVHWMKDDHARAVVTGQRRGILHLHGHWDHPDSIVLGKLSYERFRASPFINWLVGSVLLQKSMVFVGMGAGLDDPNFKRFRLWLSTVLKDTTNEHYYLGREEDLEGVRKSLAEDALGRIVPIAYGKEYGDLLPFLKEMLLPSDGAAPVEELAGDSLPAGFVWFQPRQLPGKRVSFRDYLEEEFLPYLSRRAYKAEFLSAAASFETEEDWTQALLGPGSKRDGALIHGEGGSGKTRLMYELARKAIVQGYAVIRVRAQARSLQPLAQVLDPKGKYLLLFDNIEEHETYSSEELEKLVSLHPQVRHIGSSASMTLSGGRIEVGDRFMRIYLSGNDTVRQAYVAAVTQHIAAALLPSKSPRKELARIKPAFAAFLGYLHASGRLQPDDLGQAGDFRQWVSRRILHLLGQDDRQRIPDGFLGLVASFPMEASREQELRRQPEVNRWMTLLEEDGWLERMVEEGSHLLAFAHEALADEILLLHYEAGRTAFAETMEATLGFALKNQCLASWLRAHERVAPQLPGSTQVIASALGRWLPRYPEAVPGSEWQIGITALLTDNDRLDLYERNPALFQKYLLSAAFGGLLAHAIKGLLKGVMNSRRRPFLVQSLKNWLPANPSYLHSPLLAVKLLPIKWQLLGIDEGAREELDTFLNAGPMERRASHVIVAWLESKAEAQAVRVHVLDFLRTHDTTIEARYVLKAWLDTKTDGEAVRVHLLNHLRAHGTNLESQFVLKAWLDARVDAEAVRGHVLNYLRVHDRAAEAAFVLKAWIDAKADGRAVQAHLLNHLAVHGNSADTAFVLKAWLDAKLDPAVVRDHALKYLRVHDASGDATFVLKAWLDAHMGGNAVQVHVLNYLRSHDATKEARFVLCSWLTNKLDPRVVKDHVLNYLRRNDTDFDAQYLLKAWLDARVDGDSVRAHVLNYLQAHDTKYDAQYVLKAWLASNVDPSAVRVHILNHLRSHDTSPKADYVLKAWLDARGDPEAVRVHLLNYLRNHDTLAGAQYVLKAWLDAKGDAEAVRVHVLNYLRRHDTSAEAPFVLKAWLDAKKEAEAIRPHVLNYLRARDSASEAKFVLRAWLYANEDPEVVRVHMQNYLLAHSADPATKFMLAEWLEAKGEPEAILVPLQNYLRAHGNAADAQPLLKAWLDANGDPEAVRVPMLNFLHAHGDTLDAVPIFKAWFDAKMGVEAVRIPILNFLMSHDATPEAPILLKGWLDAGMDTEAVRTHVLHYLQALDRAYGARYVLIAWLDAKGDAELVQDHVLNYLRKHDTAYAASFVLASWLDAKGDTEPVREHVLNFLQSHDNASGAKFVLIAWLGANGDPEAVRQHLLNYLDQHDPANELPRLAKAWLDAKGDAEVVRDHVMNYLRMHDTSVSARFVLTAWLEAKADPEAVREHVIRHLQVHDTAAVSRFLLSAWLEAKVDGEAVRAHVLNHLRANDTTSEVRFVLSAYLTQELPLEDVLPHLLTYLELHHLRRSAGFLLATYARGPHPFSHVVTYIPAYLAEHPWERISGRLIEAWLNRGLPCTYIEEATRMWIDRWGSEEFTSKAKELWAGTPCA